MKLLRVRYLDEEYYGKLEDDIITTMGEFYSNTDMPVRIPLKEARILAPSVPSKILAVGLNYIDHIREMGHDVPKSPVIFSKFPQNIIGHEDTVYVPEGAGFVDYEAELAVVISKKCFRISAKDAGSCILGSTCLNDVTYRRMQKLDGQWTRSKNYPSFCPVGPVIETEIDYNNADIELRLNGEIKQKSNTENFLWNVEELIEFVSAFTELYPGDLITTGTTSGVGAMYPGDRVDITIKGVGTLTNYVK